MWQRKKRQYLCPLETRECSEQDDLREARCENRNNESLIEVLKSEVECGWGSGGPAMAPSWLLMVAAFMALLGHSVPHILCKGLCRLFAAHKDDSCF